MCHCLQVFFQPALLSSHDHCSLVSHSSPPSLPHASRTGFSFPKPVRGEPSRIPYTSLTRYQHLLEQTLQLPEAFPEKCHFVMWHISIRFTYHTQESSANNILFLPFSSVSNMAPSSDPPPPLVTHSHCSSRVHSSLLWQSCHSFPPSCPGLPCYLLWSRCTSRLQMQSSIRISDCILETHMLPHAATEQPVAH